MFTISVCMIVKNEEDCIARILSCAQKFADEIIVVDTGSNDNSKKIAKTFTDKVFDFVWCNDFAKARNFSFSLATCDFQMWLDADDFIDEENIQKILKLKNSEINDVDVYMCKYSIGFDNQNHPSLVYDRERIVKRSQNFLWQGFVHEVIVPSGKIEFTDIQIQHRKIHAGNPKRNLNLYNEAIKKGIALSPREQYYYSRELFYNCQFKKATKIFKKFLKTSNPFPPDFLGAHLMLSDCFKNLQQTDKAVQVLLSYIQNNTPTAEICCKLGYLFEQLQLPENAIFWFQSALSCPKQTFGFVNEDYDALIPSLELSRLLFSSDFSTAKIFHEKAKTIRPTHPSVVFNEQFFGKTN